MKQKLILLALFLIIGVGLSAQTRQNVIKTNPIGLAFGNFNAIYERVISSSSSVLVKANYFYQFAGVDVNSFGLGGAYRYYFTNKAKEVPTGFYINPQLGFDFGKSDSDVSYSSFSLGAEIGYQWAWTSGFTLDLGIGPSFTTFSGDYEEIDFDIDGGSIVLPSLTIAIGYAF